MPLSEKQKKYLSTGLQNYIMNHGKGKKPKFTFKSEKNKNKNKNSAIFKQRKK